MSSDGVYGDPETRTRLLDAAWSEITERGADLTLGAVATRAGVSRQALYLHFGDRAGLLVALVQHMDVALDLGSSLAAVQAASDGPSLLEALMALNTSFWRQVLPVALVLEASQDTDEALGAAWRERMSFRHSTFRGMIETLDARGDLADEWTLDDAAGLLYAVAHFDTWRELVVRLAWTDDRYVDVMTRTLGRALLSDRARRLRSPGR